MEADRNVTASPLNSMPLTGAIAIVGNINLDVRTAPIDAAADLAHDGETSVGRIYETVGGGGANTALAAARLGATVHFCGAVGRDELGMRLRRHIERFGVVTHLVERHAPTGRSIALTWESQHRHFISCLPSSALLDEGDVDLDALSSAGCRHLYRADIWFAPRMLEAGGNERLLRRAREAGMQTSMDLNWDPLWNHGTAREIAGRIEAVRAILKHVDAVHGNVRELCRFTGQQDVNDAAGLILRDGAAAVIVHRGSSGSRAILPSGESVDAPAHEVRSAVNQTGSGDVFAAAFMISSQLALPERLAAANRIAAQHIVGSVVLMPELSSGAS